MHPEHCPLLPRRNHTKPCVRVHPGNLDRDCPFCFPDTQSSRARAAALPAGLTQRALTGENTMSVSIRVLAASIILSLGAAPAAHAGDADIAYVVTYIEAMPPAKEKALGCCEASARRRAKTTAILRFEVLQRSDSRPSSRSSSVEGQGRHGSPRRVRADQRFRDKSGASAAQSLRRAPARGARGARGAGGSPNAARRRLTRLRTSTSYPPKRMSASRW
jgi:hypothetical protein